MIKHYGSIAEMCDAYIAIGGDKNNPIVRKGYTGDLAYVQEAEAQILEIETKIETPRMTWTRNVAGAFCSVPDMLAGLPTPMRRRTHLPNEYAPITIIVGTASSAGLRPAAFAKRGITIVALVMALARIRPISLHIMDPSVGHDKDGETVIMAQVNTTPFDLATACYVLTDTRFTQLVAYGLERHVTGTVSWPRGYSNDQAKYYAGLTNRLGLNPRDTLIVRDAFLHDTLIARPIEWLNEQIDRFTSQEEGEV